MFLLGGMRESAEPNLLSRSYLRFFWGNTENNLYHFNLGRHIINHQLSYKKVIRVELYYCDKKNLFFGEPKSSRYGCELIGICEEVLKE